MADITIERVEQIEPERADHDATWWKVAINDGTLPGVVKVWIAGSELAGVDDAAVGELLLEHARAIKADDAPTQRTALLTTQPIQLHPEPLEG